MIVTTVMVVILIIWCTITILKVPVQLTAEPSYSGIFRSNKESLGWLEGHMAHPPDIYSSCS